MPKLVSFPGWAAPWLFAAVFAYMGLDQVATGRGTVLEPYGPLIVAGSAMFGFLIGIPFWIRDRRRGK